MGEREEQMDKLYLTVAEAAEWSGVGERQMRCWLESDEPMPYLRLGRRRLIQAAALPEYIERKQEVRR